MKSNKESFIIKIDPDDVKFIMDGIPVTEITQIINSDNSIELHFTVPEGNIVDARDCFDNLNFKMGYLMGKNNG